MANAAPPRRNTDYCEQTGGIYDFAEAPMRVIFIMLTVYYTDQFNEYTEIVIEVVILAFLTKS